MLESFSALMFLPYDILKHMIQLITNTSLLLTTFPIHPTGMWSSLRFSVRQDKRCLSLCKSISIFPVLNLQINHPVITCWCTRVRLNCCRNDCFKCLLPIIVCIARRWWCRSRSLCSILSRSLRWNKFAMKWGWNHLYSIKHQASSTRRAIYRLSSRWRRKKNCSHYTNFSVFASMPVSSGWCFEWETMFFD